MSEFDLSKCSVIVVSGSLRERFIYKKTVLDFARTLEKAFGVFPKIVDDSTAELEENSVLVGKPEVNRWTAQLAEKEILKMPNEMSDESFFIKALQSGKKGVLVVAGHDARGDAYGVYWLIDRIEAGKTDTLSTGFLRKPAFKRRLSSGDTPLFSLDQIPAAWFRPYWQSQLDKPYYPYVDEVKFKEGVERFKRLCDVVLRWGYNGLIMGDVIHLVTFEDLGIYPKNSPLYIRHRIYQKFFKEMIAYAKVLNLEFYVGSDEIVYTKPMEKYAEVICPGNSKSWDLFRAKYTELFETFPEIDGILHRLGEVFVYEPYRGVELTKKQWSVLTAHSCPLCENMSFENKVKALIRNTLEVTQKYNKTYLHRTWGFPTDNPDAYMELIKGLEKEEGFITTMKYMTGNWGWTNPLNPVVGKGDVEQMVVFLSKRQQEAHGIFPTYVGELYKKALKFAQTTKTARNIWIWVHESGVSVPNLNEITFFKGFTHWNQLNLYTTGRLAWNPDEDTFEIAYDWAARNYGQHAAENIARLLMISRDVVEKGFYIRDYAKNHDRGAITQPLKSYTTIGGGEILGQIYEECKGDIEGNIQEANEAVRLCDKMIELFRAVKPYVKDRNLYDLTLNSLEHERSFVNLLRHYREAFLRAYRLQELDSDDRVREIPACKLALENLVRTKESYDKRYGIIYTHGIFEFLRSGTPRTYVLPSIVEYEEAG
ncbi:MAG: hypothetical protein ACETV1_01250 [Candidatus Bathyarchaeia archaeon]